MATHNPPADGRDSARTGGWVRAGARRTVGALRFRLRRASHSTVRRAPRPRAPSGAATPRPPGRWRRRLPAIGVAVVVVAAGTTAGVRLASSGEGMRVSAWFDRAVGVYEGSDLRILGVDAGRVESVEPRGRRVQVTLRLDTGIDLPADARAVVIAPSLVSDRYVQLTPAYEGGPKLRPGAQLPASANATPVEVDELYASVTELGDALGPEGANENGALSDLLDVGARNLDGNGEAIGASVEQFGKAAKTLRGSSDDFFETVDHLGSFTAMLKKNDTRVRRAERQLADVSTFLADDKENLGQALERLSTALGEVKTFIRNNRGELKKNVDKLATLTRTLVDQRASLAEALDTAPNAASNLVRAYNPNTRTIDNRANLNELSTGGSSPAPSGSREAAAGTAGLEPVTSERRSALPALPLPEVGEVYGTGPGEQGKGAGR
ncbi:MCE family protein [Streptomyces sulphureus]|uniref:MCE family protein n=1 Tax=Streptomyces sulphureus TaxID=47758 RepID=UPI000361DE08|nr:MCE family protein [Streptomyces sulphureus]